MDKDLEFAISILLCEKSLVSAVGSFSNYKKTMSNPDSQIKSRALMGFKKQYEPAQERILSFLESFKDYEVPEYFSALTMYAFDHEETYHQFDKLATESIMADCHQRAFEILKISPPDDAHLILEIIKRTLALPEGKRPLFSKDCVADLLNKKADLTQKGNILLHCLNSADDLQSAIDFIKSLKIDSKLINALELTQSLLKVGFSNQFRPNMTQRIICVDHQCARKLAELAKHLSELSTENFETLKTHKNLGDEYELAWGVLQELSKERKNSIFFTDSLEQVKVLIPQMALHSTLVLDGHGKSGRVELFDKKFLASKDAQKSKQAQSIASLINELFENTDKSLSPVDHLVLRTCVSSGEKEEHLSKLRAIETVIEENHKASARPYGFFEDRTIFKHKKDKKTTLYTTTDAFMEEDSVAKATWDAVSHLLPHMAFTYYPYVNNPSLILGEGNVVGARPIKANERGPSDGWLKYLTTAQDTRYAIKKITICPNEDHRKFKSTSDKATSHPYDKPDSTPSSGQSSP